MKNKKNWINYQCYIIFT